MMGVYTGMRKIVCLAIVFFILCGMLAGCGKSSSKVADKYIGIWYGYKVSTGDKSLVFSDYSSVVKIELTCEFTHDGKYVQHYYVAGKEGEKYPQEGTYTIDGDKIVLSEDGWVGEIVNGELVLSCTNSDGTVTGYYSSSEQQNGALLMGKLLLPDNQAFMRLQIENVVEI